MRKCLAAGCLAVLVGWTHACLAGVPGLLPEPRQLALGKGAYALDAHTGIVAPGDARGQEIAAFLRDAIRAQTGIALSRHAPSHGIVLAIDRSIHGDEAYRLVVTAQGVAISAATDKGLFWGVQTLRQLLPSGGGASAAIPAVRIEDAPAFAYRGVMLDVSRHFYPVAFIEKQLDVLSYYKINTFHWHLTDDQGWRLQIERYPRLAGVGAWRIEPDGRRYGGFYTQAQVREVVDYARRRNITVIPEIEMPGHSSAALAAYPELSCNGRAPAVPSSWGIFKDIDCVGRPGTFAMLDRVLDEVADLFPSPYIHIGGDEVPKDRWEDCASCLRLMRRQGIGGLDGLQGYFVRRIQRHLAATGRAMMGWDEILDGGADRHALVELWHDGDVGRKALANGNPVVVAGPFYLDKPQNVLTTRDVYLADVAGFVRQPGTAPDDAFFAAHRAQILGGEAPLWSERANPFNAESKLYPRVLALAENLWRGGKRDEADYADFRRRLQAQYRWLDAQQVAYGPEAAPAVAYTVTPRVHGGGWRLQARRGFDDLRSRYTLDGREPDAHSPVFDDSVAIRRAGTLQVVPFRHGLHYDRATRFTLVDNLARGRPIDFARPPVSGYAPGSALVDGVTGGDDIHDGRWAAWRNADLDATIDLGHDTAIRRIGIDFLQEASSDILPPRRVAFSVSADGRHWTEVHAATPAAGPAGALPRTWRIRFAAGRPIAARYVRVEAAGQVPPAGRDEDVWLCADEILVQ